MKNAYHGFLFIRTFSIIALFFLFLNKKEAFLFYYRLTSIKPFCRNLFHLGGIP